MRSRCGGGCCWRSRRPSAKRDPDAQRRLLTFVIVGGGPTGVELAGALAEIARQSLRAGLPQHPTRSRRASSCSKASPNRAGRVSRAAADGGARVARAPRCRGAHGLDRHRRRCRRRGVASGSGGRQRMRRQTHRGADGAVGRGRRGVAAGEVARRAARSRRPRARGADAAVPGHPEIFVVGDVCALQQDGKPLPGVAQVAMQEGAHAARNILRAIEGEPLDAVPISRLRRRWR